MRKALGLGLRQAQAYHKLDVIRHRPAPQPARGARQLLDLAAASLLVAARAPILSAMFVVTEADAAAIRDVFERDGELSAAIELRRRFPGITDNARARACVRTIAGWTPQASPPPKVTRLRPLRRQSGPESG
jgi:hypothetical protein